MLSQVEDVIIKQSFTLKNFKILSKSHLEFKSKKHIKYINASCSELDPICKVSQRVLEKASKCKRRLWFQIFRTRDTLRMHVCTDTCIYIYTCE